MPHRFNRRCTHHCVTRSAPSNFRKNIKSYLLSPCLRFPPRHFVQAIPSTSQSCHAESVCKTYRCRPARCLQARRCKRGQRTYNTQSSKLVWQRLLLLYYVIHFVQPHKTMSRRDYRGSRPPYSVLRCRHNGLSATANRLSVLRTLIQEIQKSCCWKRNSDMTASVGSDQSLARGECPAQRQETRSRVYTEEMCKRLVVYCFCVRLFRLW